MKYILILTALISYGALASDFDDTKALADRGDAGAQVNLGTMYADGYGVPENDAEAVKWFRKAADQGNAEAQSELGYMYAMGEGVPENHAEAVKWLRKAADQGHQNAQVRLGTMYSRGEGVPENAAEAVKWWRKAAHHGNALAQLKLGVVYYKGIGVRKDYVMAYVFTSMAKAQQHQLRADIQVQSQQGISLVLDRLKSKMSKKKILQAQALAFKCYESDYKDCD